MNLIQAILMSVMQGLTEFLPVSSSGHIVLTSNIYRMITKTELLTVNQEEIFFDIILHLGTLLAVFIFFRKEIWNILKACYVGIKTRDFSSMECKLAIYITIGTFFSGIIGYIIKPFAEKLTVLSSVVGLMLVITGFLLLLSEYLFSKRTEEGKLTVKKAIFIGIAQGLAVFPGISRSGSTIATGLLCGLDRVTAARYSFLLSAPLILAASIVYPVLEGLDISKMATFNWLAFAIGFLLSFIVGYFCIKYFIKFLAKYSLKVFAYYCFVVGLGMFIVFQFII